MLCSAARSETPRLNGAAEPEREAERVRVLDFGVRLAAPASRFAELDLARSCAQAERLAVLGTRRPSWLARGLETGIATVDGGALSRAARWATG
jgi:hypothetical protein